MSSIERPSHPTASGARGVGSTSPLLPHPAALPAGLVFRPYAGPHDLAGMTAAANAWRTAVGFLELVTLDSMRVQYANMTNCDPSTDCVVVERAGSIAAYARVEWADTRDGERSYGSTVIAGPMPDRRAVLDALLGWTETRSTAIAAGHETDRPRILDAFSPATDPELIAACEARGFVPVRWAFEMVRPDLGSIPDVPVPPGLEIRPVRPDHFRAIWEADVEAFRDHWGAVDDSEASWERFRSEPSNDPSLWRVAWDGEEIAGQVRSYIDAEANETTGRLIGWTESISVRRPWRGRGLARSLLTDSLRAVRDRGMAEAALGVDAQNEHGALRLYESLGFVVDRTHIIFHRPLPGYGGVARSEPSR